MLSRIDLDGHRVGLQLYPDKDHGALIGAITAQGAEVDTVLPYVYDAQAADANIVTAIEEMAEGRIDAIALTNLGQVRRLIEVARAHGYEARLREGLAKTPIASVGPAVSDELKSHGLRTDIYPANDAFFMKPLISAMAAALGKTPPRGGPTGSAPSFRDDAQAPDFRRAIAPHRGNAGDCLRCRSGDATTSLRRLLRLAQIRLISQPDALLERGARAPAELGEPADIEQFARRAVGPRRIEADRCRHSRRSLATTRANSAIVMSSPVPILTSSPLE